MAQIIRQLLTESLDMHKDTETRNYFIEGPFIVAEKQNKNGRKYPQQVVEQEVARYTKEYIDENRAYGELMHPTGSDPSINFDRISHRTISLNQQGNVWVGKAIIADTEKGKIVKALIDIDGKLGVSSRGLGTIQEEGGVQVVQNDFKLIAAADIVFEPSAPGAWVDAVMEDAKEWYCDLNGEWHCVMGEYKKEIHNTPKNLLEEKYREIFVNFIDRLSKS